MIDLTGRTAIITGGANGIGFEAAKTFAKAGTRLVLVDISADAGSNAVNELSSVGHEAIFVQADVSNPEDVSRYVSAALEKFGSIDILVNNAGWEGVVRPLHEYPDDVFDKVLAINVRGVYLGLKHVLPVMYRQGGGVIINTSSLVGHIGSPGIVAYTASKHAVLGMTKTAAIEGAKHGVRVNAVSPGAVDTRMLRSLAQLNNPENSEVVMEKYTSDSPNGRLATPQDIANVMLFLASDLSNHISGQSFRVDGGRIMY